MADLVVNTAELDSAAAHLRQAAEVCAELAGKGGRLATLVPAFGVDRAAQAASQFLSSWVYGVGWIRTQSIDLAGMIGTASLAYSTVEARLTGAAGGSGVIAAPVAAPAGLAFAEMPTRPNWTLLASAISRVPVQLATATHVSQLIPGDPEQVRLLARGLTQFADALGDARSGLARIGLGGWVGAAAEVAGIQILEVMRRLADAEVAFARAGDAVARYAAVHAEARALAAQGLVIWQNNEHAAKVARGAAVATGGATLPAGVDPEAELVRAAAKLAHAREILSVAAREVALTLEEAEQGSPNDPGWLSRVTRAVTSFTAGVAEGVWGMGEGAVQLVALGIRLDPARLMYEPGAYLKTLDTLCNGIKHVASHPTDTGKALLDWDTWKEDPARAAGKLAPDLIAAFFTVGAAGSTKVASTTNRIQSAGDTVLSGTAPISRVDDTTAAARLADHGMDATGAPGRAARAQLNFPYGDPDRWIPTRLVPGQRITFGGPDVEHGFATFVGDGTTRSAREFNESVQLPPMRAFDGGDITAPSYRESVPVYEIRGELDAATALALANPQFGAGGGGRVFIDGIEDAIDSGKLVRVDDHYFDFDTLTARHEDPLFRAADPELPVRALDPAEAGRLARAEATLEELRGRAVSTGVGAASVQLQNLDHADQGRP